MYGETQDVVECFLCFFALGVLTNLSFAFALTICGSVCIRRLLNPKFHFLSACNNIHEKTMCVTLIG